MNNLKKTLSEKISQTIEKQNIQPMSKQVFIFRRVFVWCLIVFSILVSSATLSMILFRANKLRNLPYEYLTAPIKNQIADSIPLVFMIAFVVGIIVAIYEFDKTDKGYKYAKLKVGVYFVGSVALLGILFSSLGAHHVIHKIIVDQGRLAPSVEDVRNKHFNKPEGGSVIGVVTDHVLTNRAGKEVLLIQGNTLEDSVFLRLEKLEQPLILFGKRSSDGFIVCQFATLERNKKPQEKEHPKKLSECSPRT